MLETIILFLAGHMVFAQMLSVGLETRLHDIEQLRRSPPWLTLRALLVLLVGLPLLTMAVVTIVPLPHVVASLLLLFSICPGAPLLLRAQKMTEGINLAGVLTLASLITVPLWSWAMGTLFPLDFTFSLLDVFAAMLPGVVIPLVLGFVIGAQAPVSARWLARWAARLATTSLIVVATLSLLKSGVILLDLSGPALLVVVLLISGALLLGDWAGAPRSEDRQLLARAALGGNPAVALAILSVSYPGSRATALLAAYVVCRLIAALPYQPSLNPRRGAASANPASDSGFLRPSA